MSKKLSFNFNFLCFFIILGAVLFSSCNSDDKSFPTGPNVVNPGGDSNKTIKGFFLLNQGLFNKNTCSLDFYDSKSGKFFINVFKTLNPNIPHGLGDVGNDMKIYNEKLYIVVNATGLIVVLDANTGAQISEIPIPNARQIEFLDGFAFVTSFDDLTNSSIPGAGALVKFDTSDFTIMGKMPLGRQPEGIAVRNKKLYVAISGGFGDPDYQNTVAVVNPALMQIEKNIIVGVNPTSIKLDSSSGNLYVSTNGNYIDVPSSLYQINSKDEATDLKVPCSTFAIGKDYLYVIGAIFNSVTFETDINYNTVDLKTLKVGKSFINKDTQDEIVYPYTINVNPETKDILITDARDFMTPGSIYCIKNNGDFKWSATTGDIPAVITFTPVELESKGLLEENIEKIIKY